MAAYLQSKGALVTVTDSSQDARLHDHAQKFDTSAVRLVTGGDHPQLVKEADLFFTSPGVSESNPVYRAARARGLPVHSMTTLFFDLCPGKIVGVTGSSGKTTTSGLIFQILSESGKDAVIGGNIGDPMLDLLPSIGSATLVVLELSSFQLLLLRRSPHVAVVTNITPNHLDRHGTLDAYTAAKRHVVEHQNSEDYAVLNSDDPRVRSFSKHTSASVAWFGTRATNGAALRHNTVVFSEGRQETPVIPAPDIPLLGKHNVENVMAAVTCCRILDVATAAMAEGIRSYRPAPHRLQIVGDHN
ncbi:MAG: UDP-N-acetylmuramoyl-L-alanine--D-glutamate ligase, partial [Chloroflexi bacterium]